jgi:hypothetical protein
MVAWILEHLPKLGTCKQNCRTKKKNRIIEHEEEQAKLWSATLRRTTHDVSGEMMHLLEFGNSNENFKVFDGAKTSPLIWRQRASNSIWRQSAQKYASSFGAFSSANTFSKLITSIEFERERERERTFACVFSVFLSSLQGKGLGG